MKVGIVSYGAYVPRYRITPEEIGKVWGVDGKSMSKGLMINCKSVPAPDEDTITIPVEAARNMMRRCSVNPKEIGAIYVGSESHPYAVKPTGTIVAEAIEAAPDLTVVAQMAAHAVGVPVEKVEMIVSDTAVTRNSGSTSASRMTFMAGNAIKGAAELALVKWQAEERPATGTYHYLAPKTTPFDPETGHADPNVSYGYVAQAVEVEVDLETGLVRLVDVISVDDVGKAFNPQQIEGQIEGAVVQAAGYALLENFIQKDGYVQTQYLSTYLIPTELDVPDRVKSVSLIWSSPARARNLLRLDSS